MAFPTYERFSHRRRRRRRFYLEPLPLRPEPSRRPRHLIRSRRAHITARPLHPITAGTSALRKMPLHLSIIYRPTTAPDAVRTPSPGSLQKCPQVGREADRRHWREGTEHDHDRSVGTSGLEGRAPKRSRHNNGSSSLHGPVRLASDTRRLATFPKDCPVISDSLCSLLSRLCTSLLRVAGKTPPSVDTSRRVTAVQL